MCMNSHFYHIQINVNFKHASFYKQLFSFLGWKVIHEDSDVVGFKSSSNGDLWFYDDGKKKDQTNYDNIGMNHLAIRVENQKDIDALVTYLEKEKVELLFDTPRHRAEFSTSDDETYYQVMFTSPDNILFEVVYIGKKVS